MKSSSCCDCCDTDPLADPLVGGGLVADAVEFIVSECGTGGGCSNDGCLPAIDERRVDVLVGAGGFPAVVLAAKSLISFSVLISSTTARV